MLSYTKGDDSSLRNYQALAAAPCVSVWLECSLRPCLPSVRAQASGLICRQAWWDNFHILLCRLWSSLSPHQHGYACGWAQPHHTIMTVPGYIYNVLSRLLLPDFVIGCQVCTVSPYRAIKTKFLHCWGYEQSGLAPDYFNNRFRHYTSCVWLDISSYLTLHYMAVIYLV